MGYLHRAPNITGEILITFAPADDRTHDPLYVKPTIYRVAIKAGLYRNVVQMWYILNTSQSQDREIQSIFVVKYFLKLAWYFTVKNNDSFLERQT